MWALNSLRQLFICDKINYNELSFKPCNEAFNVLKASFGSELKFVVKIEKELDELMVRDPFTNISEEEDFFIPKPSYSTGND